MSNKQRSQLLTSYRTREVLYSGVVLHLSRRRIIVGKTPNHRLEGVFSYVRLRCDQPSI